MGREKDERGFEQEKIHQGGCTRCGGSNLVPEHPEFRTRFRADVASRDSRCSATSASRRPTGRDAPPWASAARTSSVAALQDLLVHSLKGLALYAVAGRQKGIEDKEVNRFIPAALFATLTNVDFDPERLNALVRKTVTLREQLKQKVASAGGALPFTDGSVGYQPASTIEGIGGRRQEGGSEIRPLHRPGSALPPAHPALRPEGGLGLHRSCNEAGAGRQQGLSINPGRPGRHHRQEPRSG